MSFPDWTQILNEVVALSVVLAPVEIGVLWTLTRFKRLFEEMKLNAEAKVAQAFSFFDTAGAGFKHLHDVIVGLVQRFGDPANRERLVSEVGHQLWRVLQERKGSIKGIAARELKGFAKEALLEGDGDMDGLLDMVAGEVDVPVLGKIPASKGIKMARRLLGNMGGGGGSQSSSSESGGGGQPP